MLRRVLLLLLLHFFDVLVSCRRDEIRRETSTISDIKNIKLHVGIDDVITANVAIDDVLNWLRRLRPDRVIEVHTTGRVS